MSKFQEHIDISGFSIQKIDVSDLEDIVDWLPQNGTFDLNIAEEGLIKVLHAENTCQEIIAKLDRYIGIKESERSQAWANAALKKAKAEGYTTAKDKEWFASADEEYIAVVNEITLAKTAKRWFENKADYFRNWQYAFKTFLRRDYSLEKLGNISELGYNVGALENPRTPKSSDLGGDIEW